MRTWGKPASILLLGLFVSLSVLAFAVVTPAQAAPPGGGGTAPKYSCSIIVTHSPGTFTVKTTVTAASGYVLPGPTETEYLSSYQNGVLYNTQSTTYSVGRNTSTTTVYVPVPSNGAGVYTFDAKILNSKGSQIATCSGTYSL